jgi:hypothetical protein
VCETFLNDSHDLDGPQPSEKGFRLGRKNPSTELVPIHVIRTETVLSKLPMHNLAKKGSVNIHIIKKNDQGQVELYWKVAPNPEYGDPRQLSYKLDTIIINQRIDQLERPLPRLIKLGSLREIGKELGRPPSDTNSIRDAALKNAATFINAKIDYKSRDGTARHLEAGFTRYTVIFTGERLPGGAEADAVYILLNEPYWEVLNNARIRPLNYDYLKKLPPASQRFYEIISYRIFSAIKYRHPQAKLLYSEYCTYSAQQRSYRYTAFKNQMHAVHRPHRQSGYIQKVRYEATTDSEGRPDWMIYYIPGLKAQAEYKAFNRKQLIEDELLQENGQDIGRQEPISMSDRLTIQAETLVVYFHQRFHGRDGIDPSPKELHHAAHLITKHGFERARYIVDFSYQQAPETRYKPQVFGGIIHYAVQALATYEERKARQQVEATIANCDLCNHDGWIEFKDSRGSTFVARCPHDMNTIQAREAEEGLIRV